MITSKEFIKYNGKKIDILKFVISIFVVAIHTLPPGFALRPVLRTAVPLFFIITSYLFFTKQSTLYSCAERRAGLIKYVKRILTLYLFWFVVLLPITISMHEWYGDFNVFKIYDIVRSFFFGSTFGASWFLIASLIGVSTIWYLTEKKVADKWIIAVGAVIYGMCCLLSNYYNALTRIPNLERLYHVYTFFFTEPYNSFPVSLLFVGIGKYLANHELHLPYKTLVAFSILFLLTSYMEFYLARHYGLVHKNDCFFSLPPLCVCMFMLVGQSKLSEVKYDTSRLRAYSTIVYCSHMSFAYELRKLYKPMDIGSEWKSAALFFSVLALTLVLSYMLLKLERRYRVRLLKYSH